MRCVFLLLIMLPLRLRLLGKIGQQASHHLRECSASAQWSEQRTEALGSHRVLSGHRTSLSLRVSEGPLVREPEHVRAGRQLEKENHR